MTDTTGVAVYATTRLIEVTTERDKLRAALERVESHGSGYAVTIAREALAALPAKSKEME